MPIASSTLDRSRPYGALTILRYAYYSGGHWWRCRCVCDNEVTVSEANLRGGRQLSCGCARRTSGRNTRAVVLPDGRRFASAKEAAAALGKSVDAIEQRIMRDRRAGVVDGWRREPETTT